MHIFITGVAGFIGANAAGQLLASGHQVTGIDNLNDYYDPALKKDRLQRLEGDNKFQFVTGSIQDPGVLADLFADNGFDAVIHMAAQAGVRYSIDNPRSYLDSNLIGTFELLEAARAHPPKHMLLASTSSAYGANTEMPYQEVQKADHQMSFYAATKKATESMAHSYAHLYSLPITMFRFFTVYGPWGRPDMSPFLFANAIFNETPIKLFNHGKHQRTLTISMILLKALSMCLTHHPLLAAS